MSWLKPSPFEEELLADTKDRWPEIIDLARVLALAPRIEPLLLRNARLEFTPEAPAEMESLLWFSPLVVARSTRSIIFHHGAARRLAEELSQRDGEQPSFQKVWEFTRLNTRHWSPEDQLERDLRYHALVRQTNEIKKGLRDILKHIKQETDEERRIELARWVKRTLPVIATRQESLDEVQMLAQYAGLALGDAGEWTELSQPQALPEWLAAKLPEPFAESSLGVEMHADAQAQVLNFVEAGKSDNTLTFPTPLPARLHVKEEGREGAWHTVKAESRIPIAERSQRIRLVTIDGQQYELRAEYLPKPGPAPQQPAPKLYLSYVDADREQAEQLHRWLGTQGIDTELMAETAVERIADLSSLTTPARLIRLWTKAAQNFWEAKSPADQTALNRSLILRTDEVELPFGGKGTGMIVDWLSWWELEKSPEAETFLARLRDWLGDESGESVGPIQKPEWAEVVGEDEYGFYADFSIKDVRQRMRWIEPGEFMMGSPDDEAQHTNDEIQHRVVLTKGFWLADTACTQALWQAVMGNNPSNFKGEERPVEWVSWEDVQDFIEGLNAMVTGQAFRLPTEAEWEYACRAGTTTPFWFGDQITPEQVNYDGNYPYADGKKGRNRRETVDVKALPCNGWGLYQMHGNVWEWCQDWYGKYDLARVEDPAGPAGGRARVLRGGCWFGDGWYARAARRGAHGPAVRRDFAGFRLARGQPSGQ